MRLLELPDALKDGLITGVISEGHARALAAIPEKQQMIEAYKMILREGGSVRRAEELARRFKKTMHKSRPSDGFETKTVNEWIDSMASEIQSSIGNNAHVKMRRSRIETAIHIVLKGNPEETEAQIQQIYSSITKKEATNVDELAQAKEELIQALEAPTNIEQTTPELLAVAEVPSETNPIDPFEPFFDQTTQVDNTAPKESGNFPDY